MFQTISETYLATHSHTNMWTITFVFVIIKTLHYIRMGSTASFNEVSKVYEGAQMMYKGFERLNESKSSEEVGR